MTTADRQPPNDDEEVSAYEALADRTREALHNVVEATGDALERAVDEAKEQTAAAGEFTGEQIEYAADVLKRDLLILRDNSDRAMDFVQKTLDPSRVASAFLGLASDVFSASGDLLTTLGDRLEGPIRYETGEVTGPGTLTCLECDTELHFEDSGRVPPCGKCHKTEFRKSY